MKNHVVYLQATLIVQSVNNGNLQAFIDWTCYRSTDCVPMNASLVPGSRYPHMFALMDIR